MKYNARIVSPALFLGALLLASPLLTGAGCNNAPQQGDLNSTGFDAYQGSEQESAQQERDVSTLLQGLSVCSVNSDCASDEACTQGGHCVNNTGQRDATYIFQAEVNALEAAHGMGVPYRLPSNGVYLLTDLDNDGVALRLDDKIIFDGQGALLLVEPNTTAIRVGQPSEWSMVRNFRVEGLSDSPNDSIGVDVRAHGVRLENITFQKVGIGARSRTYIGDEYANVNSQQWTRLSFYEIFEKAIDFRGGDANAGLILGAHVRDGAGIYERSFLGNTYIAPWIENTHSHSLDFASNAGRNVALGAYINDQGPAPQSASMHDIFVGGNYIDRIDGSGDRIGAQAARLHFADVDSGLRIRIPGSAHSALAWMHPQEEDWWFLRFFANPTQQRWGFSHRNTGVAPFFWTGGDHPDGPGIFLQN